MPEKDIVAESVGSEGYRLPASCEQLGWLTFPQKTASYPCAGRSLKSGGKLRNSPRIQEFETHHQCDSLWTCFSHLFLWKAWNQQRKERTWEWDSWFWSREDLLCVLAGCVRWRWGSRFSESRSLKAAEWREKVQGTTRGDAFCLRQREASSSWPADVSGGHVQTHEAANTQWLLQNAPSTHRHYCSS